MTEFLWPSLQFLLGAVILTFGAEWLVSSAVRLSQHYGISPLVVGLTVVSLGTSAPELGVSVFSQIQGSPDIAVGNILGSNIFNILIILGLSALIRPLIVHSKVVRLDVPIMIGVSFVVFYFSLNRNLSSAEGAGLVLILIGFLGFQAYLAKKEKLPLDLAGGEAEPKSSSRENFSLWKQYLLLLVGFAGLLLGSNLFVDGASTTARLLGVSELVIGLTIVALGTSLPEVATSMVAAFKGQNDIAVGNVVGSNIFNLLAVLGLTSLFSPAGISISLSAIEFDFPVVLVVSLMSLPIFLTGFKVTRSEGIAFLFIYASYLIFTVLTAMESPSTKTFVDLWLSVAAPLLGIFFCFSFVSNWISRRSST